MCSHTLLTVRAHKASSSSTRWDSIDMSNRSCFFHGFFWTPDARLRAATRLFRHNRYFWVFADPISLFGEGDELSETILGFWGHKTLVSLTDYIHPITARLINIK